MGLNHEIEMTAEKRPNYFTPPFAKEHELQHSIPMFAPYHPSCGFDPRRPILDVLNQDLVTRSIDRIHPHLWLAGLPKAARPLHRQVLLGRTIVITEDPNEHLVWHATRIFVKALPEYLLCHEFWTSNSALFAKDYSLYQCACGLLLSYTWLICSKSDLAIAHDAYLLPRSIPWEKWIPFITSFLSTINPESLSSVSSRYYYGELRLSRLNLIYRLAPSVFSTHHLIRGFMSESLSSGAFFERNFAWLLSVFAFVSIVASSMQVGLATNWLQGSQGFQTTSVVFTAGSLVVAAASVLLVGLAWGFLFFYHIIWARANLRIVTKKRERVRTLQGT